MELVENIHVENDPAMYSNDSKVIMANYTQHGYQNYAAIVGDTYGSEIVLLNGPHPELSSQNSSLLLNMVLGTSKRLKPY
jgi:glutamine amidotransferase-like uncharacterized protein